MFDLYPQGLGEMAVWIISNQGERTRFIDNFQSKLYIFGKQEDLEAFDKRTSS